MGFRSLRVINEDRIRPGGGFPTHGHRDMEIITYIVSGALEHRDNMGTGSVIRPGEAQRMTAGAGVLHSEFNASEVESVHLLQIWILPERRGIEPSYEQQDFSAADRRGRLLPIVSPDRRGGSLLIHQDAVVLASTLEAGDEIDATLRIDRHMWLQIVKGSIEIGGIQLAAGDGAAVSSESRLEIRGLEPSELIAFDLA